MSDSFPFRLSVAIVLHAVEEYVNQTFFSGAPIKLTGMALTVTKTGYEFTAEPAAGAPHARTPRKTPKRGLKAPVLEQQEPELDSPEQEPEHPVRD